MEQYCPICKRKLEYINNVIIKCTKNNNTHVFEKYMGVYNFGKWYYWRLILYNYVFLNFSFDEKYRSAELKFTYNSFDICLDISLEESLVDDLFLNFSLFKTKLFIDKLTKNLVFS